MSKEIIDHGFGIIETKETYYTENEINQLKQQIEELKAEIERLKEENTAINQIAEMVGKISECETALEVYDTTQQNRILMFNNQRLLQQLKDNTKQVCDNLALSLVEFSEDFTMSRDEILEWLQKYKDQIEKGNKDGK